MKFLRIVALVVVTFGVACSSKPTKPTRTTASNNVKVGPIAQFTETGPATKHGVDFYTFNPFLATSDGRQFNAIWLNTKGKTWKATLGRIESHFFYPSDLTIPWNTDTSGPYNILLGNLETGGVLIWTQLQKAEFFGSSIRTAHPSIMLYPSNVPTRVQAFEPVVSDK